jgi:hypothetical protein
MEPVKDILYSLRDNLKERFTNPFLSTFLLALIIINWKVVYTFIYLSHDKNVFIDIKILEQTLNTHTSIYTLLVYPIIVSTSSVFIFYLTSWCTFGLKTFLMDKAFPFLFEEVASKRIISKDSYDKVYNLYLKTYELLNESEEKQKGYIAQINTHLETIRQNDRLRVSSQIQPNSTNSIRRDSFPFKGTSNPQKTDYFSFDLEYSLLKSITFTSNLNSFLRVGIKIGNSELTPFNDSEGVKTEGSYLFHYSKNINDDNIFLSIFDKNKSSVYENIIDNISNTTELRFKLNFLDKGIVEVKHNDYTLTTLEKFPLSLREKFYILAWGDDNEFELEVKNINVSFIS